MEKTLLLVDDDDDTRVVLRRCLRERGFTTILEATDGQEALELFRRHKGKISVVLCDLQMPRVMGTIVRDTLHQQGFDRRRFFLMSGGHWDTRGMGVDLKKTDDPRVMVEEFVNSLTRRSIN